MSFFKQNVNDVTRRIASKVVGKLTELKATVLDQDQEEALVSDVSLLVYPTVSLIFETKRAAVQSIDNSELIQTIRDAFMKEVGQATRESHDQLVDTLSTLALQAVVRRVIAYDSGEIEIEENSDVAQDAAEAIIRSLRSVLAPRDVVIPIATASGGGYKYYEADFSSSARRASREISYDEYTKLCDVANHKYTITQAADSADETKRYYSTVGGFTVLFYKDEEEYEVLSVQDAKSLSWSSLDVVDPTQEERHRVAEFLAETTTTRELSRGSQKIIRDTMRVTDVSQESVKHKGGKIMVTDIAGRLSHPARGDHPFILPFSNVIADRAVKPIIASELSAAFEITGYPLESVIGLISPAEQQ